MDTAIIAMSEIVEKIPEAELLLIGKGPFKKELVKIVSELSLERNVTITDQQPFKLMPTFIEMSSVCIVPHNSNPHTEATSPHKLFQYMLMGKPVVVSSCRPLKRIIEETGAGVVFEAGDSHSFAEAVIRLYNDPELREQMGQAGKKAVLEKYNWNITAKRLVRFYSRFTPESS
jgi:glycosyltransferase involved in cell wall biosynthesis